jgi:uncharacterized phage protein gp47/JayE
MATFPAPSDIQSVYLQVLKSIKSTLNINDPNSDFVIRGKAISGLISGLYGDQAKINADTFVSTARPEALVLKGLDLGLTPQSATQASSSSVTLSGPNGLVVAAGDLQFLYGPTNLFYVNTTGGTFANGSLTVAVQAQVTGSLGNVSAPDVLTLVNPPVGVNATATLTLSLAGGSDVESYDSFRARILARQQYTPAGGNEADYKSWGFQADPSVRSVSIRRFIKGLGTVGVVITSGVTDIDQAVTGGVPVVRIPSAQVVANVQSYYDSHAPLTDCPTVFGPIETPVDVTMQVSVVAPYTLASIPSDPVNNPNNLTIEALVQREVGRALYKAAIGGRTLTGQTGGFIVASDIEANIDYWLSASADPATGLVRGRIPVLNDRQIMPLNGTMYDLPISANSLARPGTISVVSGVS